MVNSIFQTVVTRSTTSGSERATATWRSLAILPIPRSTCAPSVPPIEILALLVTGKSLSAVNAQENTALIGAIASLGLSGSSGYGQGITERVTSRLGLESLSIGGGDTLEDSALGLGKYLSPDLLMRYKVGLFDRQSVLGIEYTLNEHLKLKVESGISQSVEFSYTIEKD